RSLPAAASIVEAQPLREFTMAGYLRGLANNVEVNRLERSRTEGRGSSSEKRTLKIDEYTSASQNSTSTILEPRSSSPLAPDQAASQLLIELGLDRAQGQISAFKGSVEDSSLANSVDPRRPLVVAVLAADASGLLQPGAAPVIRAARMLTACIPSKPMILLMAPEEEASQRLAIALVLTMVRW